MPLSTRDVLVVVRARDVASRVIREVGTSFTHLEGQAAAAARRTQNVGAAMTAVGVGMAAVGGAGLAAMGAAANQAIEFGNQAAYAYTQVDQVGVSLQDLEGVALRAARNIPKPVEEMNEALFDIFSTVDVGLPAAEHMLQQFAKAAVAGQTEVRTAARLTMALMNAYQLPVSEVNKLMDMQFQLVRKGVGEYEDFAGAMGKAIPIAKANSQEVETLFGMLTFLTRRGMNAREAVTSTARAMELLYQPKALENLKGMGIATEDAEGNFRQLNDIMIDLMTKGGFARLRDPQWREAMETLFGKQGRIQARRFFDAVRDGFEDLDFRVDQISTDAAGAMQEAYDEMFVQPRQQIQLFKNAVQEVAILFGKEVLPQMMPVIDAVRTLVLRFADMSPTAKRAIAILAGSVSTFLAVTGVVVALAGAFVMLTGTLMFLGMTAKRAAASIAVAGAGFFLLTTIAFLLIAHWDETVAFLQGAWKSISRGLDQLQQVFATALNNILQITISVGRAIYQALQWLNPFARHSPSLVEDVRAGVAAIVSEFSSLDRVIPSLDGAREALRRFKTEAAGLVQHFAAERRAEIERYLGVVGPELVRAHDDAAAAVDRLEKELQSIDAEYGRQHQTLTQLRDELDEATRAYRHQEQVVAGLEATLRRTGDRLSEAQESFRRAQKEVRGLEQALTEAERKMRDFANAPLKGAGEFEDKLFALDQEAAKVRQQMLQWEAAGAPPETLEFFRHQLDDIARRAEQVRLEEKLELDPLRREIEKAIDTTEEMTFEEIMEGIAAAKDEIEDIGRALPDATKRMIDQEKVVEDLQELYDQQQAAVDAAREVMEEYGEGVDEATEKFRAQEEVLQSLRQAYSDTATEISRLRQEMQEIIDLGEKRVRQIEEAQRAAEQAAKAGAGGGAGGGAGAGAGGGGFDIGGLEEIDPEEHLADLDDFLGELDASPMEEVNKSLERFTELGERFGPLVGILGGVAAAAGAVWGAFKIWGGLTALVEGIVWVLGALGLTVSATAVAIGLAVAAIIAGFVYLWNTSDGFRNFWIGVWEGIKAAAKVGWAFLKKAWEGIVAVVKWAWNNVIEPVWKALVAFVEKVIVPIFKFLWDVVKTVWDAIVEVAKFSWSILRGIFTVMVQVVEQFVIPMFRFFWQVMQTIWNAVVELLRWVWNSVMMPIFRAIKTVIETVVAPVLRWLWHSVFEPVWSGISSGVKWAWNNVIKPVWEEIKQFVENTLVPIFRKIGEVWGDVWNGIKNAMSSIWGGIKTIVVNAVNGIIGFVERFLNNIIDAANLVGRALNKLPGPDAIQEIGRISLSRVSSGTTAATGGSTGGGVQALHTGGDVLRAGVFRVAEDELLHLPRGSAVRPSDGPRRGGGDFNIKAEFIFQGDIHEETLDDVEEMINDAFEQLDDEIRSKF